MSSDGGQDLTTFIDALIEDQRRLSAVERFSRSHAASRGPALAEHYRELIPLSAPRPGEQYAFEVDLDRCSGCKACVTACHSLNGLDEEESWRNVGLLVGATPLQQTVTTACHHCVEPACLLGCPVLAYDKDAHTGIVRHLDDQCIGCSYCILMCPYDAPKYSARRGIVRKCDMCHGRLADGEAPACVQACPNEAIRIDLVSMDSLKARYAPAPVERQPMWLPDAPHPGVTAPTTRYLTKRAESSFRAADHAAPRPQPAHWPLVLMLTLTQAGIGVVSAAAVLAWLDEPSFWTLLPTALGVGLFSVGLAASVFHLGQPRKAWRVWLGWRTSWLSREALVLNAFAGVAGVVLIASAARWLAAQSYPPSWIAVLREVGELPPTIAVTAVWLAGAASLWAQTKVYSSTQRPFWSTARTAARFFGTALILGLASAWALDPSPILTSALIGTMVLKLASEISLLKRASCDSDQWTALRRTAALQLGPLRPVFALRLVLAGLGGVLLPFVALTSQAPHAWAAAAATILLFAELAERWLFFTSVAPDKMPGLPS